MYIDGVKDIKTGYKSDKKTVKRAEKGDFESVRIDISKLGMSNTNNISKSIVQNINEKFNYGLMLNQKNPLNISIFDEELGKLDSMMESEKQAMKNLDRMLMINSIVRRLLKGKRLTPEQRQFLRENPDAALEAQMELAKEKMFQGPERRKNNGRI